MSSRKKNGPLSEDLQSMLTNRLAEKHPLMQFLLGPRQVGKTTSVKNLIKHQKNLKILFVSADGIAHAKFIDEQWQKATVEKKILVIDEIQKIPNWSEVVKKNWDLGRNIKCVFLGSSSLDLQTGINESLTGRFEIIQAYHWGYTKSKTLKPKMTLEQFLIYGGYPGSYAFFKDQARWQNYLMSSIIETVIGKDILTQAKVSLPGLFRQTFYILANLPAQVMSYNKMLGQLQDRGNIDIIKYYIDLFEAAFLIKAIHKFTNNEVRKKQSSPKIIALAPALNTFHRLDNLTPDYMGHVFESVVGATLVKKWNKVYYWAEGDYEVDYIIEHKGQTIAIEVKSGRTKRALSLEKFLKKYQSAKPLFINKDNFESFEKDPVHFVETLLF
jgi:predicted AAA+ superfamily ATPase